MGSKKPSLDFSLREAIAAGDVATVQNLLDQNAIDQNFLNDFELKLFHSPYTQNHVKIVKSLAQHGVAITRTVVREIFSPECSFYAKELVVHILSQNESLKMTHLMTIFIELVKSREFDDSLGLEILKLLLEQGLPVDDFGGYDFHNSTSMGTVTPLHHCITNRKSDFVLLLIQHGANVHKKTSFGDSPLVLAAHCCDPKTIEVLLKNGAEITEKSFFGATALHVACSKNHVDSVRVMLKNNVDINVLTDQGNTTLQYSTKKTLKLMLREIAKFKFEGLYICPENLNYLGALKSNLRYFESCLVELQDMKSSVAYGGSTFYDVLHMGKSLGKLLALDKNEGFVDVFKTQKKHETFKQYKDDLYDIFLRALKISDVLMSEVDKLNSIFKAYLPELVIYKVAYYLVENVFYG